MKTLSIRSLLLPVVALALAGVQARAQAPAAAAPPDYSKVEIKIHKVSDNFSTLEGMGGTIGVLTGPEGVFMVDTQFPQLSQKIAAAIKTISPLPIRFIVNTHVHPDHTGGDENFARMGATIFAREELRDRLAHPATSLTGAVIPASPAIALPIVTYRGPVTLHMDGEIVDLIPIVAHTDGDTLVYFRNNDVLMTGDAYRAISYPFVDKASGGSVEGMIEAQGMMIGLCGPNTKVVPGHGPTVDRTAIMAMRDMLLAVQAKVAAMIKQGMTQEQVVAAHPTAEFDAKFDTNRAPADRLVGAIYGELKAAQ